MKEKISQAEMIRRLKEVTADEDKYFPGVLGNPVTFAGRWGLSLSKGYRHFKAKQFAIQKRVSTKSPNSQHARRWPSSVPKLTFGEFEKRLAMHIPHFLKHERAYVWEHIRTRIREVNRLGAMKISRVRNALLNLEPDLGSNEALVFNRFEPRAVVSRLDKEVFGA